MAKLDVAALKAAGLSDDAIAKVQAVVNAKTTSSKCTIVDYTTSKGVNYKALNVKASRVFVKVDEAESVIKALQDGLTRAKAGEVDEKKAAAASSNPTE